MKFLIKRMKKLMILLLLIPIFTITTAVTSDYSSSPTNSFSVTGSGIFNEDFTTTTYRDAITTASGWGDGYLSKERDYTITQLDFLATSYAVRDIEIQGHKAFLSVFNDEAETDILKILELTDLSNLQEIASRDAGIEPGAIGVSGDLLVAGLGDGTQILRGHNITNPLDFDNEGTNVDFGMISTDGRITDIEIDGHYVYVAVYGDTSNKGVRVINATNPANFIEISNNINSDDVYGLFVRGKQLFVTQTTGEFLIFNVTSKDTFNLVDYVDTGDSAKDVIVDGDYAYVANSLSGVTIVDIEDPTDISIIGQYDTPGSAGCLAKAGNTLYVVDNQSVLILDVVNPALPVLVDEISISGVWDVELYGGDVLFGCDAGVYSYRIGNGIADAATTTFFSHYDDYQVWDVRVEGDVAYVAAGPDGFYTLDLTSRNGPLLLDRYPVSASASLIKLDIYGDYAFAISEGGIYIFDVSDPSNIVLANGIGGASITDIYVESNLLYISFSNGLGIVNITDIKNTDVIYSENLSFTNATALWVQGQHLHIVDNIDGDGNGYYIYDIRDLSAPVELDKYYFTPSKFYDVYVDGDLAYLAGIDNLYQFNVSDPEIISLEGSKPNNTYGVWNFGPYVMSADSIDGFSIIDATDPSTWSLHSTRTDATGALQVTVAGDYAYIANTTSLIIQRIFYSAGDSFASGLSTARSIEIDTTDFVITNATLSVNEHTLGGSRFDYFLSPDGGTTWEEVTPDVLHTFSSIGTDLRFSFTARSSVSHRPYLYSISINYGYDEAINPTPSPTPTGPSTTPTETGGITMIFVSFSVLLASVIVLSVKKKKR